MPSQKDNALGADYTGELTPLAMRRLNKEKDQLSKEDLSVQGMFFHFDETHGHKAVVLIIGPEETPYAGGFYLFEFTFPNNYPLKPPHVKFMTSDNRVRFNPNLYVNGKVCLSILGTWQGPSWTAACTFRTTLFSIQSLLHNRPLQNEPGYENETGNDCELYSALIRYENINVAVLQLARELPESLQPLRTAMARTFIRRFADYEKVLDGFEQKDGKQDRCPLYAFVTKYSPSQVRKQLKLLREKLMADSGLAAELCEVIASSSTASTSVTCDEQASAVAADAKTVAQDDAAGDAADRKRSASEEADGEQAGKHRRVGIEPG
jgi:ubiquitin-conjugating enzyme E2 Z